MATLRLLSRSSGLKLNKIGDESARLLPSAGGHHDKDSDSDSGDTLSSKKRKRHEFESEEAASTLDESEIRAIQKQHKIKITDLRALHGNTDIESRKSQKQAARVFPQPLQNFAQLESRHVSPILIRNILDQAYRKPTEVQLATIPLLLASGDEEPDLLTVAPTGSGKTLAFLIPLIQKTVRLHQSHTSERQVSSVILAPTRELVGQIVNEGKKLAMGTGVRIVKMRKGMRLHTNAGARDGGAKGEIDDGAADSEDPEEFQSATLVKADVLVSTPLLLLNAITDEATSEVEALPHIWTLVLDEADYLLDPLFRDQVMSVWSACTSSHLRVSLWSATIGSSIEETAISKIQAQYSTKSKHRAPLLRIVIGLKDTSLPTISHKLVYASTETGKLIGLRQLLHPAPSASPASTSLPALRPPFLIFTQTIPRATALHDELRFDIPAAAGGSTRIAVLHSDLSSTQRAKTMTEFRQGKIWILITTDLLSRGIDFRGINGVVNYDIPTTAASYVHRAGRTGRAGREGGICVTFYTKEDIRYLKPIASLIASSERTSSKVSKDTKDGGIADKVPQWLLAALPELSKQNRKELKQRGVDVRRAVKESDDKEERRKKGKNRIGTSSGYERKLQNKRQGMIEGSKRRYRKEMDRDASDVEEDGFEGFGD